MLALHIDVYTYGTRCEYMCVAACTCIVCYVCLHNLSVYVCGCTYENVYMWHVCESICVSMHECLWAV